MRAYADRVHDDVRRLGCTATEAAEVVEHSALGLAERLRVRPHEVRDLVGTWFRDARTYAERVASGEAGDVAGEGIVQSSADDEAARSALARLADRDRVALLLRDAYDLPYPSVGVALGLDADTTAVLVARARLRFLRLVSDDTPGEPGEHDAELASLARLADSQLPPDAVAGTERHAARCPVCGPALPALREARRLLSGLAIIAMDDADRDSLIARATAVATRVLPSAEEVAAAEDAPYRGILPPAGLAVACLGGAVVLGAVIAIASGGTSLTGRTAPPFDPGEATPTASATTGSPTPTATATSARPTATTSHSATPSHAATPSAAKTFDWFAGSERIELSKTSGDNGETVRVSGTGWKTGDRVTIVYLNALGVETGQRATAVPNGDGTFSASLVCFDPTAVPGQHRIRATNSSGQQAQASYNAAP